MTKKLPQKFAYVKIVNMFETLIEPQIQYLLLLQEFRQLSNGILDSFFLTITTFGEILIPMSILSVIYWGGDKKAGTLMLFSFALALYFNIFLKMTACIKRPWLLDSRVCPVKDAIPAADGYSFPSGHTAGAVSIWGSIAYHWWNKKLIRYIMILLVLLVAFSRNYVGVHTPQDIIVSIIVGILLIFIADKILHWVEQKQSRDVLLFTIFMFFTAILYIYLDLRCDVQMLSFNSNNTLLNPIALKYGVYGKLGFLTGIVTGWIIERRFIRFTTQDKICLKKIFLITLGLIIFCNLPNIFAFVLHNLIPYRFESFLTKFFMAFYITALYPLVIKRFASR